MGVPILRIPVVALKVLLDYLNNIELVTVSLLSRRAEWFLKACGKKNLSFFNLVGSEIEDLRVVNKLELFLLEGRRKGRLPDWNFKVNGSVGDDVLISISCTHFEIQIYFETLKDMEKIAGTRRSVKIGESIVPVEVIQENERVEKMRTFWNTKSDGMIVFMNSFEYILNLSIELLSFAGEDSRTIRTVAHHINSSQLVVKNVQVELYPPISEGSFKFILKNVSATEKFYSQLILSRNFKFNGAIRAKNIEIRFGQWFTLQSLLSCNESEVIFVRGSGFTEQELSTFLKKWVSGRFPKLKEVNLVTKVNALDVTKHFEKRKDKCENTWGRQVEAIRGHGDSYGTVEVYPTEGLHGFFHMRVHNG